MKNELAQNPIQAEEILASRNTVGQSLLKIANL